MEEYLSYWRGERDGRCLYLKDWHFFNIGSNKARDFYQVPEYFQCDWLNEYLEHQISSGKADARCGHV